MTPGADLFIVLGIVDITQHCYRLRPLAATVLLLPAICVACQVTINGFAVRRAPIGRSASLALAGDRELCIRPPL